MKRVLLLLMTVVINVMAVAQFNYSYTNARYFTGTYTDIGAIGSTVTMTNPESGNSSTPIDIGFNFSFNGTTFTQCMIHADGILRFGTAAPGSHPALFTSNAITGGAAFTSSNSNYQNVVFALFMDLVQGSAMPSCHVLTEGIAPGRVTTIQWKNLKDNNNSGITTQNQFDNLEFQVKLYETSNDIRIVYGSFVPSSNAALARNALAGIKASGTSFTGVKKSSSLLSFSAIEFLNPAAHAILNSGLPVRKNMAPTVGSGYVFFGQRITDISIAESYVERTVSRSVAAPTHNSVRVKNEGTAALSDINVTMQITGANTFNQTINIASLAAGGDQVVEFSGYSIANSGDQDVLFTAAVAGDENTFNNTLQKVQSVSNNYVQVLADSLSQLSGIGFNGIASNEVAVKIYGAGIHKITQIRVPVSSFLSNVSFRILEDDGTGNTPGTVLHTSTSRNTNGDNEAIYNLPSPVTVDGDYYISIRQNNTENMSWQFGLQYPVRTNRVYNGNGFTFSLQATDRAFLPLVKVVEESSLPDVGIVAAASPFCNYSNTVPVSFSLRNYSSAPHDFSVNPVTIAGSVVNDVSNTPIPFSIIRNTGTLAPGAIEPVTVIGSYDFSIRAGHRFTAKTIMAGDAEPLNDSLSYLIVNNARITKSYTDSICPFTSVTLTALNIYSGIQWEVNGLISTGNTLSFEPGEITVVRMNATDHRGCTISDSVVVPVKANGIPPSPVIAFSDTLLSYRNGFSDTLSISDLTGHTVNWQGIGTVINGGLDYVVSGSMGQDPEQHLAYYRNVSTGCGSGGTTIRTRYAAGLLMENSNTETLCDTSFYDNGGPVGPYNSSGNFVKTFYPATPGSKVRLSLYSIILGQFSTMRIYDGTSTSAAQIGRMDRLTANTLQEFMASGSDGAITVSFSAGGSSGYGWLGGITCEAPLQYRSVQNGSFEDAATWESKTLAAPGYTPATRRPFKGDDAILIRHTISVPSGSTLPLDQTVVDVSGTLSVPTSTTIMLYSDGAEYDLTVNGTLNVNGYIYGGADPSGSGKINLGGILNLSGQINIDSLVAGPAANAAVINTTGSAVINKLRVNNPNGMLVNGNLDISRALDLQNGVVVVASYGFIRLKAGEGPVLQGGSADSYINGKIRWQSYIVSYPLSFPVGKNGMYRKLELMANQSSYDSYVEYEAEFFTGAPPARTLPATFTGVNQQWYHTVSIIDGSSYFMDATVTIYYEAGDGITDPSLLLIGKDDGADNWTDIGGTATGSPSGSITSNNFSTFSDFVLANLTGTPLPVTLLSFNGKVVDKAVHLNWKVENEVQFARYETERSVDGTSFIKTGTVAAGFTSYQYIDAQPPPSAILYYRLKMIDKDGSFRYSGVIQLRMDGQLQNRIVSVAPNPFKDRIDIQYESAVSQRVHIQLVDMTGKVLKHTEHAVLRGVTRFDLEMGSLPMGTYVLKLVTADKLITQKIIKQ